MDMTVARSAAKPARLLLCFSHLRWDFVFQRPQHLLTRAARSYRVCYVEEPVRGDVAAPRLALRDDPSGVTIATPELPEDAEIEAVGPLLDALIASWRPTEVVAWYYTPMALAFSAHLRPDLTVYDCMDELSNFRDPPPGLATLEDELFERADLVFTGGHSLYEAKRRRHRQVFAFPSSVDVAHFGAARDGRADPADQAGVDRPRVGFFGVIDERMDLDLVAYAAERLRDVAFVMLGPVAKIDPRGLPRGDNLHWLGPKRYAELPDYLAHWDAGWMPFALNAATRFISPTKTPEFLAAGLPVVSTAVPDVIRGYAGQGLVAIADRSSVVVRLREALSPPGAAWRARVDRHLAAQSWDRTWAAMEGHLLRARQAVAAPARKAGA
jgi:glycosyltransferase involved in cell wall biosynthesis